MLGNYLQQTTSADDIFRCIFLGVLRVNPSFASGVDNLFKQFEPRSGQTGRIQTVCTPIVVLKVSFEKKYFEKKKKSADDNKGMTSQHAKS